jgi:hypothetical protein
VSIPFPSLEFFEALQKRTALDAAAFEKLGYCDTNFGVRVGDQLFTIRFEVFECVEVRSGGDAEKLDFVLSASADVWKGMIESIVSHGGADAEHTLNTLSHVGDVMRVEYADAEGHDCFYRFMASVQEFFNQAQHLDVALS